MSSPRPTLVKNACGRAETTAVPISVRVKLAGMVVERARHDRKYATILQRTQSTSCRSSTQSLSKPASPSSRDALSLHLATHPSREIGSHKGTPWTPSRHDGLNSRELLDACGSPVHATLCVTKLCTKRPHTCWSEESLSSTVSLRKTVPTATLLMSPGCSTRRSLWHRRVTWSMSPRCCLREFVSVFRVNIEHQWQACASRWIRCLTDHVLCIAKG